MPFERNSENLELTKVYIIDDITYVPHYRDRTLFVGPGYPMGPGNPKTDHCYTAAQLEAAGAMPGELMLWPRPQFGAPATT